MLTNTAPSAARTSSAHLGGPSSQSQPTPAALHPAAGTTPRPHPREARPSAAAQPVTARPARPRRRVSLKEPAQATAGRRAGRGGRRLPIEAEIIGTSIALKRALAHAKAVAPGNAPVLIQGPTGSGKEAIAHLVHQASRRAGPFIAVNCASLTSALVESELFGHVRGAFTGATDAKPGLFESANNGTLFLDEIGELRPDVQAHLLRVLQEGKIRRVGATTETRVNVRIVAATHRDLAAMAAAGTFREDLLWRLAGSTVQVPPLAERGRDVLHLAKHILATSGLQPRIRVRGSATEVDPSKDTRVFSLSDGAARRLLEHSWPGNVRELQKVLREVCLLASGPVILARHVQQILGTSDRGEPAPTSPDAEHLVAVLSGRGEILSTELRSELGLPRTSLWRLIQPLLDQGQVITLGKGRATRYRWVCVANSLTDDKVGRALTADERRVLALVAQLGVARRRDLVERLGLSMRTASRVLGRMVEAGSLRSGNGATYVLTSPAM